MFVPHPKLGKIGIVMSGHSLLSALHLGSFRSILSHGLGKHLFYMFGVSGAALTLAGPSMAQKPEEFGDLLAFSEQKWSWIDRNGPRTIFNFPSLDDPRWKIIWELWHSKEIHFKNAEGILENKVFYKLLDGYDPARTILSPMRFDIRVFDHVLGKYRIISNRDAQFDPARGGDPKLFRDFLIASASLDLIFPPMHIGDSYYSDGDSIEVLPAVEYGCDTIFVFRCYPRTMSGGERDTYGEVMNMVPMIFRSIINKFRSLRRQDGESIDAAFREVAIIRGARMREKGMNIENIFKKTVEQLREQFNRFVGSEPGAREFSQIAAENGPHIIRVDAPLTIPPTYTSAHFEPKDVFKGVDEMEKHFDEMLEEIL